MRPKKVPRSKTAIEIAWDMFRLICMMDYIKYTYDKDTEQLHLTYLDQEGREMDMICKVPLYEYEKVLHDLLLK